MGGVAWWIIVSTPCKVCEGARQAGRQGGMDKGREGGKRLDQTWV